MSPVSTMNESKTSNLLLPQSQRKTLAINAKRACTNQKIKRLKRHNLSVTAVSKNRLVVRTLPQCDAETKRPL